MVEEQPPEGFLKQVEFINNFKIDIQKLIISLSTGALVFSTTLIEINPGIRQAALNKNLKTSWILLTVSIVSGVLGMVFSSWWFGNRLLTEGSKEERFKTKFFMFKTKIYNFLAHLFEHMHIWSFIFAIIFLAIFAINNFCVQNVPN